jgi:aminopeptidase N
MTAVESVIPPLEEWFGTPRGKVVLVELTDPDALPYNAGAFYFVPMRSVPPAAAEVALARPVVHAMLESPRPWIREGLASFAQALIRERQGGRRAALDYLGQFSYALVEAETESQTSADASASAAGSAAIPVVIPAAAPQPLVTTADEIFFRTKAAYVWWMLRDKVGDHALQSALAAYHAADDRDTGYMQRLIERQLSPRPDLESFFDDWVYRDRGLPQLRVNAVHARITLDGQTVTAVTVENLGNAGCEVPVSVRSASGEGRERLLVPAKSKATVRVSLDATPTQAEVNDGSVPESGRRDHVLPVTIPPSAQ